MASWPNLVKAFQARLEEIDPDHIWKVYARPGGVTADRHGDGLLVSFHSELPDGVDGQYADTQAGWVESMVGAFIQAMRDPAVMPDPLPISAIEVRRYMNQIRANSNQRPDPLTRDEWFELEAMIREGTPPSRALMTIQSARQPRSLIGWPPHPLVFHEYAPADINKGYDLPCCDMPKDDDTHRGGQ